MLMETKAFVWRGRYPKFTIYIKKYNIKARWMFNSLFKCVFKLFYALGSQKNAVHGNVMHHIEARQTVFSPFSKNRPFKAIHCNV